MDSRLAADLRAVAVLELAEAALRYAGHEADPATCRLYKATTPVRARELIEMLHTMFVGAAEAAE